MALAIFPPVRPAWIVHRDADLLVVDKPAGVSSQSADPDEPDDLPHRLRLYFESASEPTYLGIHQRLDRDTSGVLVYARRKEANPGLARQFEGRSVEKLYRAVVAGYRGGDRVLRHRLLQPRDGRVEIARPGDRRAKEAVTRARVIARRGDRALLELAIETGRTHQIRAQLAAEGAPVVGDPIYGGAPAERLMLHAASITLVHPGSSAKVRYEAPVPAALERALGGRDFVELADRAALEDALVRAIDRRFGLHARLARAGESFAMRLFHRDGDGAPDLAVDLYDRHLVAHLYAERDDPGVPVVLDVLASLGADGVYVKHRPKEARRAKESGRGDFAKAEPSAGVPAPAPLVVHEDGVPYRVRLDQGLSTGIFLDQRDNRRRVREASEGKRVLNLFAYTCAFSLAAARGGAAATVSVDVAGSALRAGEEGFAAAGVMGAHEFVRADVFKAIAAFAREGRRFDLVVCDPPTFSTTRDTRWSSRDAWEGLVEAVMSVTDRRAILLLSSNDHRMTAARFRRFVHRGVERAGRKVERLRDLPPPSDFPPRMGGPAHLKSLWLTVA